MAETRKRRLGRWAKVAGAVAAGAIALAVAGKWWLAPAVVRWQVHRHLPEYWDGSAELGAVEFSYCGLLPLTLRDVVLRDRQGRQWLRAETVRLAVPNWPSLRPRLGSAIIASPRVTLHCAAGRCELPLRKLPSQWWAEYVDLRSLLVQRGRLEVRADGEAAASWGPGDALLQRGQGGYRLSLPGRSLVLSGLVADATVADDGVEFRHAGCRVAGGRIAGRLVARLRPSGRVEAHGALAAQAVDLGSLRLPIRGARQGVATGVLRFRLDANGLTGRGAAAVQGADLRDVPIASAVMRRAGLGQLDVMRNSDVELTFTLRGGLAAVEEGRVRLPLAAVDLEPGGTIDLRTGQLDVVVVIVLFEKVRPLLKGIPLVGLVVDLTEQFSRFRVRGGWDDPDSVTIASVPLADMREGSRQFLTAAARGGGSVGRSILGGLTGLLNGPGGRDPNAPGTAASRPTGR